MQQGMYAGFRGLEPKVAGDLQAHLSDQGASSAFKFSPGNPVRTIIRFKREREGWEYAVESNELRWKKFERKNDINIEYHVLRYVKTPCRSKNGKAKFVQP